MRTIDPTAAVYDGAPFPRRAKGGRWMKVRLISPFLDAEQIWIGLDEPGMRRKAFRFVSPDIGLGGVHGWDHPVRAR